MEYVVFLVALFPTLVLANLKCYDYLGQAIDDGEEYKPKREDPCYSCLCDKGYATMCRTVSCSPPKCSQWEQVEGMCCQFRCTGPNDPQIPEMRYPNFTGETPHGDSTVPTTANMTDLGLRLVASTVTILLILAMLLFLIHRLRQKRLLVALRRYRRRQDPLDDSDNVSYLPEFYGLQCPPYEDPPPPYSPPKPYPSIQPGEQPPPYEALDSGGSVPQASTSGTLHHGRTCSQNPGIVPGDMVHTQQILGNRRGQNSQVIAEGRQLSPEQRHTHGSRTESGNLHRTTSVEESALERESREGIMSQSWPQPQMNSSHPSQTRTCASIGVLAQLNEPNRHSSSTNNRNFNISGPFSRSRISYVEDMVESNNPCESCNPSHDYQSIVLSADESLGHLSYGTLGSDPEDVASHNRLRELRLSHLMNFANGSHGNDASRCVAPVTRLPGCVLQCQSVTSDNSVSVCSDSDDAHHQDPSGTVLSSDAQYPDNAYRPNPIRQETLSGSSSFDTDDNADEETPSSTSSKIDFYNNLSLRSARDGQKYNATNCAAVASCNIGHDDDQISDSDNCDIRSCDIDCRTGQSDSLPVSCDIHKVSEREVSSAGSSRRNTVPEHVMQLCKQKSTNEQVAKKSSHHCDGNQNYLCENTPFESFKPCCSEPTYYGYVDSVPVPTHNTGKKSDAQNLDAAKKGAVLFSAQNQSRSEAAVTRDMYTNKIKASKKKSRQSYPGGKGKEFHRKLENVLTHQKNSVKCATNSILVKRSVKRGGKPPSDKSLGYFSSEGKSRGDGGSFIDKCAISDV